MNEPFASGPPPLPPPKKKQTPVWIVVLASLAVCIVGVPTVGIVVFGVASVFDHNPELQRIAIREGIADVEVCPSEALHACRLRYGSRAGVDLVFSVSEIRRLSSCDGQYEQATIACYGDGGSGFGATGHEEILRCMASWGVLDFRSAERGDVRDEHLAAGEVRLVCAEGHKEGTFASPAF